MKHPIERDRPLVNFLMEYHRHEIRGLEILESFINERKSYFLVGNHGFNFIEPALLVHSIYNRYRQIPRAVGHFDLFFKFKEIGEIAKSYGVISHEDFRAIRNAIDNKKSLLIYPGGEDEAMLRDYRQEPYTLKWEDRPGFAKLAIKYKVPIIFVMGIGIDEMVFQGAVELPPWIINVLNVSHPENYQKAKWFWNGIFPAPVKITHIITEPIELFGEESDLKRSEYVKYKLRWLQKTCQARLDATLAFRDKGMTDPLDSAIKGIQTFAKKFGF